MNQVYEISQEKYNELVEELQHLKTTVRNQIIEDIKEARAQGDLSENADYDAARDAQSRNEKRISEIEDIIANSKIINKDKLKGNEVSLGKKVLVRHLDENNLEEEYEIVGTIEADPDSGKISTNSPLGKAILGKTEGEIVTFYIDTRKRVKGKLGKEKQVEIVKIK